jgi:hypothetical protein
MYLLFSTTATVLLDCPLKFNGTYYFRHQAAVICAQNDIMVDVDVEVDAEAEAAAAAAAADENEVEGGGADGDDEENKGGRGSFSGGRGGGGGGDFNSQKGLVDFKPFDITAYEKVSRACDYNKYDSHYY